MPKINLISKRAAIVPVAPAIRMVARSKDGMNPYDNYDAVMKAWEGYARMCGARRAEAMAALPAILRPQWD